jgi:DMSO/TMAO reductase YedYZ molybdopterin-dependent catalytic subunit
MRLSRRKFLAAVGATGAAASSAFERLLEAAAEGDVVPVPNARFVRNVPLGRFDGRPAPQLDTLLGKGLDARQFFDHSGLTAESLVTPTERFFVRTAASPTNVQADSGGQWFLTLRGETGTEAPLDMLAPMVRDMGTHLLECSGNSDPANFGLISVARWSGVPLASVLERFKMAPSFAKWSVRVLGLDDEVTPSRSSVPGASWIFSPDDLTRTGAFLATKMNGADLTPDHGFPVRLIVPTWYGCASIKWVSHINIIADSAPATPHMQEFAERTHQNGVPALAREFEPPVIDLAAMPIRVEQWRAAASPVYRIIGVRWGGTKQGCALTIRFRHDEPFVPVDRCDVPAVAGTSWSLWSHLWRPAAAGRYQIVLGTSDPSLRTRRLDLRYYTRDVQIDEI